MKNLLKTTLILFLTFTLFNCSSDDSDDTPTVTIVETWNEIAIVTASNYDINNDGEATNNMFAETGCISDATLIFKSDGTGELRIGNSFGVYHEGGSFASECIVYDEVIILELTWTQSGNTRTYTDEFNTYEGVVIDGSELQMFFENGFPIFVDELLDTVESFDSYTSIFSLQ
ncbi:hypothetical protein [Psychroserpens sp.]